MRHRPIGETGAVMPGGMFRKIGFALVLASASASTSAHAVNCWSDSAAAAAKVRDLETMLMVSALRCRLKGQDFLPQYNEFVRSSRPALVDVNERLRQHFARAEGPAAALNAYDRYVTAIANSYGAGVEGLDCTDMESILGAAQAAGHSLASLEALAERAEANPQLPGGRCDMVIAQAR